MEEKRDLQIESNFINRELSWLEFNDRVLEEAQDNSNPLLERLKFISIVSSNLDEFFMVRVGSLWDQVQAGFKKPDPSGLTPIEQLKRISLRSHKMIYDQYNCFNRSIAPALKKEGILFIKNDDLSEQQVKYIQSYYFKNIYPVITPMVVDKSRPFPLILNKSLNIAVLIRDTDNEDDAVFATVQVPSVLQRVIEIPSETDEKRFIFLDEIIKMNIATIFNGHNVKAMACYRLTRNADLSIDEEGAEDLLEAIEQSVKQRKWGAAIRLEVEKGIDNTLLSILTREIEIEADWIYEIPGPLDLSFLMKVSSIKEYEHLKFKPFKPAPNTEFLKNDDIFQAISKSDIVLHHPYESFNHVVDLVRAAAKDPDVLAIKQTLYRVSGNSPIVEALMEAAEKGKQVTVLVELKARFDEENNINWARRLEQAGCHVIYGLVGLKTHGKILLIVRREEEGIKRYVHMGTGNYNDVTANIYTDIGFFSSNPYFGADASALFNMLSGYSMISNMYRISIAPVNLRDKFIQLINQEKENARKGKPARIIAKVNSLVDDKIIEALYEASNSGVEIDLIVRGVCCLRPGIKGLSERIQVRSIVGRFLEHSRIYYFYNSGEELIYLSSADWMQRNLDRRVEILFPIQEKECKKKINKIIEINLRDTEKARILKSDGSYVRVDKRGKVAINCQTYFYAESVKEFKNANKDEQETNFRPITSPV